MKNQITALVLGLAFADASFAAAKIDLSKLPPPSDKLGLTFEKDIRPIFEASCLRCHGSRRARADLRLDTRENALKGGEDGKVITVGKSRDSILVHAIARLDDEGAMPPTGNSSDGPRGRVARDNATNGPAIAGAAGRGAQGGRGGNGTNGPAGRRGFGMGMGAGSELAARMITDGDKNADKKLAKDEFAIVADAWFAKFDTNKTGKVTSEEFAARSASVFPRGQGGGFVGMGGGQRGGGGPGAGREAGVTNAPAGQRGGGMGGFGMGGRSFAPGLFTLIDADKDGSVNQAEMRAAFAKWFADWDKEKTGSLTEEQVRDGLTAMLPRPDFSAFGGFGGGGPGGDAGPPAKPLTAEEVGVVRAWIDQGAH